MFGSRKGESSRADKSAGRFWGRGFNVRTGDNDVAVRASHQHGPNEQGDRSFDGGGLGVFVHLAVDVARYTGRVVGLHARHESTRRRLCRVRNVRNQRQKVHGLRRAGASLLRTIPQRPRLGQTRRHWQGDRAENFQNENPTGMDGNIQGLGRVRVAGFVAARSARSSSQ